MSFSTTRLRSLRSSTRATLATLLSPESSVGSQADDGGSDEGGIEVDDGSSEGNESSEDGDGGDNGDNDGSSSIANTSEGSAYGESNPPSPHATPLRELDPGSEGNAEGRPEGEVEMERYRNISNDEVKAILNTHLVSFQHLPQEERAALFEDCHPNLVDIDTWALAYSPSFYRERYLNALDEVTLVPYVQKHPRDHELYKDWVMLGRSNGLMYIEPRFKEPLVERLQQAKPFQPNTDKRLLSKTNIGFATLVVIDILEELGCETIRHVTYGKKLPISQLMQSAGREPAEVDHPLAWTNFFDIGQTTKSSSMWLFRPEKGQVKGTTVYPIAIPLSQDFGTVNVAVPYRASEMKVKIYTPLIHQFKGWRASMPEDDPSTYNQLMSRRRMMDEYFSFIGEKVAPEDFGGFRIEATIHSPTLAGAVDIILASGVLDVRNWIESRAEPFSRFGMEVKVISKELFMLNAGAMIKAAKSLPMWKQTEACRPTAKKNKVVRDVMAALGNNARNFGHTTAFQAPKAWWLGWVEKLEAWQFDPVLEFIKFKFNTADKLDLFYERLRGELGGHVPCENGSMADGHWYQKNHRRTPDGKVRIYGIRCKNRLGCTTLGEGKAKARFAQIIRDSEDLQAVLGLRERLEMLEEREVTPEPEAPPLDTSILPRPTQFTTLPLRVFHFLCSRYPTGADMWGLLKSLGGGVPCVNTLDMEDGHGMRTHGKQPFRTRCLKCKTTLNMDNTRHHFANMVDMGLLSPEQIGYEGYIRPDTIEDWDLGGDSDMEVDHGSDGVPLANVNSSSGLSLASVPVHPSCFDVAPTERLVALDTSPPAHRTTTTARDGSCQFHAFNRAMTGGLMLVQDLRNAVAEMMLSDDHRPTLVETYVSWSGTAVGEAHRSVEEYIQGLRHGVYFGNDATLGILSKMFGINIAVIKDENGELSLLKVGEQQDKDYIILWLGDDHYENVVFVE
ncbi:hypothetical protein B9479_007897 [Cryptococcus floricola]|uniref:OTU domain-containing protein n=1 Tax=Cryptococcus floricola TaxID=2591691 RepID=A0A5D3AMW5_9TREE|nr:hypothetical protein B9479_007897 [Cryptococcus floricola]